MARRFEIHVRPGSELQGEITAVINPNRIRREGESEADTPYEQIVSPAIRIETRTQLESTWDVPDNTIRGGRVEVGVEFPYDVVQTTDETLMENFRQWLTFQGLEVNSDSVRVEVIQDDDFSLRLSDVPASVRHDENFTIGVRTTFGEFLSSAPTSTALSLSTGSVNSVCQIIANQSYLFDCTAPSSGTTPITITAFTSGWSNLTSDFVFSETIAVDSS